MHFDKSTTISIFLSILDCQYFYICISGQARRNGCTVGQVFNKETLACDAQENVRKDPQCRNWYNETFLEGVNVPQRPGGVPLDTTNRERVVVRRRKPSQQVSISTSEVMSTSKRTRPALPPGVRPTVPPSVGASRPRNKVRTRVRRPPPTPQEELLPIEEGPPSFALSSAEDIQRFRESNPFGPQSDQGRLTVLNEGGFSRNPPQSRPRDSLQPQRIPESQSFSRDQPPTRQSLQPQRLPESQNFARDPPPRQSLQPQRVPDTSPIRSFAAIPAVPDQPEEPKEPAEPAAFGSRFQSRRPPTSRQPVDRFPAFEPEETPVRSEPPPSRFSAFPEETEPRRQTARTRPGAGRRPPVTSESFEPQRVRDSAGGGRQRLEVTEIRVNPQVNQDFTEEPIDIEAFRRVASRFRNRGSQQ